MKRGRAALEEVLRRHKRPRIRVAPPGERTAGGRRWPSKKHRQYYERLELRRKAGEVLWYVIEPRFVFSDGTEARFDFLEVLGPDCLDFEGNRERNLVEVRVVDVKGMLTSSFIRNWKRVRAEYGVEAEEA